MVNVYKISYVNDHKKFRKWVSFHTLINNTFEKAIRLNAKYRFWKYAYKQEIDNAYYSFI